MYFRLKYTKKLCRIFFSNCTAVTSLLECMIQRWGYLSGLWAVIIGTHFVEVRWRRKNITYISLFNEK